jgi:hypothetical protein
VAPGTTARDAKTYTVIDTWTSRLFLTPMLTLGLSDNVAFDTGFTTVYEPHELDLKLFPHSQAPSISSGAPSPPTEESDSLLSMNQSLFISICYEKGVLSTLTLFLAWDDFHAALSTCRELRVLFCEPSAKETILRRYVIGYAWGNSSTESIPFDLHNLEMFSTSLCSNFASQPLKAAELQTCRKLCRYTYIPRLL